MQMQIKSAAGREQLDPGNRRQRRYVRRAGDAQVQQWVQRLLRPAVGNK